MRLEQYFNSAFLLNISDLDSLLSLELKILDLVSKMCHQSFYPSTLTKDLFDLSGHFVAYVIRHSINACFPYWVEFGDRAEPKKHHSKMNEISQSNTFHTFTNHERDKLI